jgi:hypothetical protein
MIATLERAFGIDENIGDILGVPYLAVAFADLEQRALSGLVGSNRSTGPKRARQRDVSWKFSPLIS